MVATADALYLSDNDSCKIIDPATGKVRDEIVLTEKDGGPGWKWMALHEGVLYALVGKKDPLDPTLKGTRTQSGWPWSGMGKGYGKTGEKYEWGFGRTLVAIDLETKKVLWTRPEPEAIDSRAMALRGGKIFLYAHGKYFLAVNTVTGGNYWKSSDKKLLDAIGLHGRAWWRWMRKPANCCGNARTATCNSSFDRKAFTRWAAPSATTARSRTRA